ncbi:hypothetical protein AB0F72_08885 [Actinoplanes sp. NPDC023936]|uniref:hypothetical protein n=1 Tax=Actinoplanes sp. NPDC023936 TaxID=3154910 RepID=UPI0033F1B52B
MTQSRPGHPSWCRKDDPNSALGRHLSVSVRAGVQRKDGEAVAWLSRTGHGPTWLTLLAAHMTHASVRLSLDDAVRLRDGITKLLRQAGHE